MLRGKAVWRRDEHGRILASQDVNACCGAECIPLQQAQVDRLTSQRIAARFSNQASGCPRANVLASQSVDAVSSLQHATGAQACRLSHERIDTVAGRHVEAVAAERDRGGAVQVRPIDLLAVDIEEILGVIWIAVVGARAVLVGQEDALGGPAADPRTEYLVLVARLDIVGQERSAVRAPGRDVGAAHAKAPVAEVEAAGHPLGAVESEAHAHVDDVAVMMSTPIVVPAASTTTTP